MSPSIEACCRFVNIALRYKLAIRVNSRVNGIDKLKHERLVRILDIPMHNLQRARTHTHRWKVVTHSTRSKPTNGSDETNACRTFTTAGTSLDGLASDPDTSDYTRVSQIEMIELMAN